MSNDDLAVLAGGDSYEAATVAIDNAVLAAKRRLEERFPFFFDKEYPIP